MAIDPKDLAAILVAMKIATDTTAATTMITEPEVRPAPIPAGTQIFATEELATRDKTQYDKGKSAGEGMLIKDAFTKELPEYAGKKDMENFVAELVKKGAADGGKDVDTKVKERDTVIQTLRGNIKTMEADKATHAAAMLQKEQDTDILMWTAHMKPDNFTPQQWVMLIKSENELAKDESGATFVKRDGKIVQDDKLATPIPPKDALLKWITDKKFGKVEEKVNPGGGRGEGDSKRPAGGIRNMTQFQEYCTENKIDIKSSVAQAELAKVTKEVADFDFKA